MSARKWLEFPIPAEVAAMLPGVQSFTDGTVRVLRGVEGKRLHLSVSVEGRYPTWDELADVRYDLTPYRCDMVMVLPPEDEYVNLGPLGVEVFHLWEMRDAGMPREQGFGQRTTREGK